MIYGMYIRHELTDQELMSKYRDKVRGTVEEYGGQYLASDGHVEVIEDNWSPPRTVLIAFNTREDLDRWWNSPECQATLPFRLKGAKGTAIVMHRLEA